MPRPSTIKRLPNELQDLIGRLREQGRTIDEILNKLAELEVDVSRSALGRHIQQLDKIGEEIRRSRSVAEALVARFGDAPESRVARLNIELGHALLMKLMVSEDGQTVSLDPEEAMFVTSALRNLSSAAKTDTDVILTARKEAAKQAAAAVDRVAKTKGLSADTVSALKAEFLGIGKT